MSRGVKTRAALSVWSPGDRVESRWLYLPPISGQQTFEGDLLSYKEVREDTEDSWYNACPLKVLPGGHLSLAMYLYP